jgi:hypothetical protein
MATTQRLGLPCGQFTVKPLMITMVHNIQIYLLSENLSYSPQLVRIVSNFCNRFWTQVIQAVKHHYDFADLDGMEQVETAMQLQQMTKKSAYLILSQISGISVD